MNLKLLDLFCGSGGASKGFQNEGFKVTGIDSEKMPFYCGNKFIQDNVFNLSLDFIKSFDIIWASPPCQAFASVTNSISSRNNIYPDLISKCRKLLKSTGKPYVIENIPNAPLRKDLVLCGQMFDLGVIRHRVFEIEGFKVKQIKHQKHIGKIGNGKLFQLVGHQNGTLKQWQTAINCNWIKDRHSLAQTVPPAYAQYIARFFKRSINRLWSNYCQS